MTVGPCASRFALSASVSDCAHVFVVVFFCSLIVVR